jgi:PEP-CTERM motif
MKTLWNVLAVAGLMLAAGNAGRAAEIGYDTSFTGVLTDITNMALNLNDFNSSLGTLTSVTLYLQVTETGSVTISNTGANTATFDLTVSSEIQNSQNTADNVSSNRFASVTDDFIDTPNGVGPYEDPNNPTMYTLGGTNGGGSVDCGSNPPSAACTDVTFNPLTINNTQDEFGNTLGNTGTGLLGTFGIEKNVSSFGQYYTYGGSGLGAGTFSLDLSTLAGLEVLGNGASNVQITRSTTVSAYAEVDYTYTPASVPEPATFWLIGGALAGAGLLRRRARKA